MTMNRRTFQKTLLLAVGAAACVTTLPVVHAATATSPSSPSSLYKYRLKFRRAGGSFNVWIRIVKPSSMSSDVPFTLLLSSDAQGKNVLQTKTHVARAASSHLVRGTIDMRAAGWTTGSPLYARFLLGEEQTRTKARKLRPSNFG